MPFLQNSSLKEPPDYFSEYMSPTPLLTLKAKPQTVRSDQLQLFACSSLSGCRFVRSVIVSPKATNVDLHGYIKIWLSQHVCMLVSYVTPWRLFFF